MFITQLDRITEFERGRRLVAKKSLTLAEEYLQDHFPRFPVMPGVLMLEALTQASAWLIRLSEDFEHSMVVLKEARNVKYSGFVQPGETLEVTVDWFKDQDKEITLKAAARVGDRQTVSARLIMAKYNLSDSQPDQEAADGMIRRQMKELFQRLDQRVSDTPAA